MAQLIPLGRSQLNRFARKIFGFRIADLKWENPLNLGLLHAFSSTSGSVSKKRSVFKGVSMRRRKEDMKKKDIGRNKKSMLESKNVPIGDVLSSGTVGTKA